MSSKISRDDFVCWANTIEVKKHKHRLDVLRRPRKMSMLGLVYINSNMDINITIKEKKTHTI